MRNLLTLWRENESLRQENERLRLIAWGFVHISLRIASHWALSDWRWQWWESKDDQRESASFQWDGKGIPPLPKEVADAIKKQMEDEK